MTILFKGSNTTAMISATVLIFAPVVLGAMSALSFVEVWITHSIGR